MLFGTTQAIVEAAIDRLAGTGDRLSDLAAFKDTLATLPERQPRRRLRARLGRAASSCQLGKKADPTGQSDAVTQAPVRQDLREARRRRAQLRLLARRDRQGPAHALDDALRRQRRRRAPIRTSPSCSRACRRARGSRPPIGGVGDQLEPRRPRGDDVQSRGAEAGRAARDDARRQARRRLRAALGRDRALRRAGRTASRPA